MPVQEMFCGMRGKISDRRRVLRNVVAKKNVPRLRRWFGCERCVIRFLGCGAVQIYLQVSIIS